MAEKICAVYISIIYIYTMHQRTVSKPIINSKFNHSDITSSKYMYIPNRSKLSYNKRNMEKIAHIGNFVFLRARISEPRRYKKKKKLPRTCVYTSETPRLIGTRALARSASVKKTPPPPPPRFHITKERFMYTLSPQLHAIPPLFFTG